MHGTLMADIEGLWLTAEDRQFIRQPEVGGLILFARNIASPEQVRALCASIRQIRPDMLLAVDQEGGRVQRLRQGFVRLPAMGQLIDQPNAEYLARECGWIMATEVLAVGLDISFAPVLDLNYGRSQVIGLRAFAGTADETITLAGAFIEGMNEAGMSATGKHFPGHGWAEADSHVAMPTDSRDLDALWAQDLKPFAQLAHRLGGVMPAHVVYPAVDHRPAGFSPVWMQLLREQIGFKGLVFSDDLSMVGAHGVGDAGNRIEAALQAGCDMGLVCNDRASAETALKRLQQLKVQPVAALQQMRGQGIGLYDYKQQPRWARAVNALRRAGLID